MGTFPRTRKGSSKKRPFLTPRSKASNSIKTLYVEHADGSSTKITPNPDFFDGDFKALAISLARKGEFIKWRVA